MSGSVTLSLMPQLQLARGRVSARAVSPALVWGVVAGAAALAVYVITLAPELYSLDSPELSAAAYRLGIAHPPGYPLYTLSGWLFSHAFPVSNAAFRLNLFSALLGVTAAVAVYALALRLAAGPVPAAVAALALAFSYWFWSDSLTAEIYTLDAALFAGLLLAACAWRARPSAGGAALVGLLFGLGLATRTTTLLYLPALAAFAWRTGPREFRPWLAAAGGAVAGLSFYLYLPLRGAAGVSVGPGDYGLDGTLRVWDVASFAGFVRYVAAWQFAPDAFAYGPLAIVRETGTFGERLAGSFLIVGVPLGMAGIARLWSRDRAFLLFLLGCALPVTAFFIDYGAVDKEFMFLPAYIVWALFIASGISWTLEAVDAPASSPWALAALVLPGAALLVNARLVSLRGEHGPADGARATMARVAPDAIVYGPFIDLAAMQYLQQVEHARPDVKLVNGWTSDDAFLVALARANAGRTPLYVTRDYRVLRGEFTLVAVGDGAYEVRPRGAAP